MESLKVANSKQNTANSGRACFLFVICCSLQKKIALVCCHTRGKLSGKQVKDSPKVRQAYLRGSYHANIAQIAQGFRHGKAIRHTCRRYTVLLAWLHFRTEVSGSVSLVLHAQRYPRFLAWVHFFERYPGKLAWFHLHCKDTPDTRISKRHHILQIFSPNLSPLCA